jgi:hypothetical protein
MTAAQLSQVRTIGHLSADTAVFSNLSESPFPNYPFVTSESLASFGAKVLVTDGMVAVQCGATSTTMSAGSPSTSSTRWFDSVTFTLVK